MSDGELLDRELLELAALAAGYKWHAGIAEERAAIGKYSLWLLPDDGSLGSTAWNPLEDDGDAFRLAVFLTINIESDMAAVEANVALTDISVNILFSECNNDPYAATRRAIVRAAAAIAQQEAT